MLFANIYACHYAHQSFTHLCNCDVPLQLECAPTIFGDMKTVLFVRHAKSSWKFGHLRDHDRPLNDRGHRDGPTMASHVKNAGVDIEMILSSTAKRARTTAEYFQEVHDIDPSNFWTDRELYHASPETLVEALVQIPEDVKCVAIFAHNPGMTILANQLSTEAIDNVPTCGVTIASYEGLWAECQLGKLEFIGLLKPKEI